MNWLIPSYYVTYIVALVLSVRYLWNKGELVRSEERQKRDRSEATNVMPQMENSHGKWCEHIYLKNGKCTKCGYNAHEADGKPFVADCNCPRCGWRDVHDLEPLAGGARRTCKHCRQTWWQI